MRSNTIALFTLFVCVSSIPVRRDVDPNLVPQFGFQAGLNPTGTGDCDGIPGSDGKPIKIPCDCPPPRQEFLDTLNANVAAGHVLNNPTVKLSFPTDDSKNSKLARINAAAVTLQNLHGPGKGCPIVSTTFSAQAQAISDGTDTSSAVAPASTSTASTASTPASPSTSVASTASQVTTTASTPASSSTSVSSTPVDPNLVPPFGFQSGLNPTGTGDCDGIPGSDGKPIKIPCDCPPPLQEFLDTLNANVAAGHVLNNPTVKLSFPTDDSKDSKLARINAAAVTLQNLHGPGKGCPIVSTTFSAQAQAISDGTDTSSAAIPASTLTASTASTPASPSTSVASTASQVTTTASTPTSSSTSVSSTPVDPNLVPPFGFQSGLNPTGTGDCDGIPGSDGKPIKIPCDCPPPRQEFLDTLNANVAAGHVLNNPTVKLSFPTDDSKDSKLARINAAAVTLQNLHGPGKGCPIVSTTFSAQAQAISDGTDTSSAVAPASTSTASTASTPASSPASVASTASQVATTASTPASSATSVSSTPVDPNLVPQFGFQSGLNPTGTGDCDGIPGKDGKPIKIPCSCPPPRQEFLDTLNGNVAAGHVLNNPSVKISFPTDDSKNSKLARINAAVVTLQNLHGPGKGCPVVSTTFSAQAQAISDGTDTSPSSANLEAVPVPSSTPSTPSVNGRPRKHRHKHPKGPKSS